MIEDLSSVGQQHGEEYFFILFHYVHHFRSFSYGSEFNGPYLPDWWLSVGTSLVRIYDGLSKTGGPGRADDKFEPDVVSRNLQQSESKRTYSTLSHTELSKSLRGVILERAPVSLSISASLLFSVATSRTWQWGKSTHVLRAH